VTDNPNNRIQTFEDTVKVNGQREPVRVTIDSHDGRVITMFPARSS
jgi:hypothetical protein